MRSTLLHLFFPAGPSGKILGFSSLRDIGDFNPIFETSFLGHPRAVDEVIVAFHLSFSGVDSNLRCSPKVPTVMSTRPFEILENSEFEDFRCIRVLNKWCEALSSISSIQWAQRAKFLVSHFHVTFASLPRDLIKLMRFNYKPYISSMENITSCLLYTSPSPRDA